jgi:hypothetical protein
MRCPKATEAEAKAMDREAVLIAAKMSLFTIGIT